MVPAKKTLFYWLMREWCYIASRLYFKRVETEYLEPLPKDKPIIFVGNHCNTFIDPILISVNSRLYPAFLATAAAFKNPLVAKFLHAIRMLPIYRKRDGGDTIKKNEKIFDISIEQLEANLQFVIFAEGSHSRFRRLRPFKKGFARIGFSALEKNNGNIDVQVIPVGVEYRQYRKMHQEVLQTYGKPIPLREYWEDYQRDKDSTISKLTEHVYGDLKELLIHIPTEKHYEEVESLRNISRPWLYDVSGLRNPGLHDKLLAEQEMIAAQTAFETKEPEAMDAFGQKIQTFQKFLDKHNFRSHLVQNAPYSPLLLVLQLVLMLPFVPLWLFGVFTSYLPYKLPGVIANKLFRDDMYHGAVNYAGGLFFFSATWIIETLLVLLIFKNGWITLAFALLMPLISVFSFRYWLALKKWWHRWRFTMFSRKNRAEITKMKKLYDEIIEGTKNMIDQFGKS